MSRKNEVDDDELTLDDEPTGPTAADLEFARAVAELNAAEGLKPTDMVAPAPQRMQPATAAKSEAEREFATEQKRLEQQEAQMLLAEADYASGRRTSMPPMRSLPRFARKDPTIPRFNGKDIRNPRFLYKWVPETDMMGEKTDASLQVETHMDEGYVVAPHPDPEKKGQPYRSKFGILMQTTGTEAAFRERAHAPHGAIAPDAWAAAQARDIAEDTNRRAGQVVLRMRRPEGESAYRNDQEEG